MSKKIIVIFLVLSMFSFFSCDTGGSGVDIGVGVDNATLNVLKDLIKALNEMPEKWEEVLINAIDELGKIGTEMATAVSKELQTLLILMQGTVMCSTDFIIDRVNTDVLAISHNYFPLFFDEPVYLPHICSTLPAGLVKGSDQVVIFSGYYFTKYTGSFTADIEYGDGTGLVSGLEVAITDDYTLSVNLQTISWSQYLWQTLPDSPQLILRWDGGSSELFLSICTDAHEETVNPGLPVCTNKCASDAGSWQKKCKKGCPKIWPGSDICKSACEDKAKSLKKKCNNACKDAYPPIPGYTNYEVCE